MRELEPTADKQGDQLKFWKQKEPLQHKLRLYTEGQDTFNLKREIPKETPTTHELVLKSSVSLTYLQNEKKPSQKTA